MVVPINIEEARIWNYYNGLVRYNNIGYFDWWRMRQWPSWLKPIAKKKKLSNGEVYKLFTFFVGNGLDPLYVVDIFKMVHGVDSKKCYDIVKRYTEGKLDGFYWDLITKKLERNYG